LASFALNLLNISVYLVPRVPIRFHMWWLVGCICCVLFLHVTMDLPCYF
jgi:hypothetical protein